MAFPTAVLPSYPLNPPISGCRDSRLPVVFSNIKRSILLGDNSTLAPFIPVLSSGCIYRRNDVLAHLTSQVTQPALKHVRSAVTDYLGKVNLYYTNNHFASSHFVGPSTIQLEDDLFFTTREPGIVFSRTLEFQWDIVSLEFKGAATDAEESNFSKCLEKLEVIMFSKIWRAIVEGFAYWCGLSPQAELLDLSEKLVLGTIPKLLIRHQNMYILPSSDHIQISNLSEWDVLASLSLSDAALEALCQGMRAGGPTVGFFENSRCVQQREGSPVPTLSLVEPGSDDGLDFEWITEDLVLVEEDDDWEDFASLSLSDSDSGEHSLTPVRPTLQHHEPSTPTPCLANALTSPSVDPHTSSSSTLPSDIITMTPISPLSLSPLLPTLQDGRILWVWTSPKLTLVASVISTDSLGWKLEVIDRFYEDIEWKVKGVMRQVVDIGGGGGQRGQIGVLDVLEDGRFGVAIVS